MPRLETAPAAAIAEATTGQQQNDDDDQNDREHVFLLIALGPTDKYAYGLPVLSLA